MLIPHISLSLLALHSRRDLIHGITTIAIANILTTSSPAIADDSSSELYLARPMGLTTTNGVKDAISRPSAPIEYLLPAARVGVYIYTCVNLAEAIAAKEKEDGLLAKLDELENLLVNPPSFVKSSDPRPTRGDPYKLPPVVGELVMQQQKQKERQQNSIDVGAIPQFFEVGQLIGERRAWDRLTKTETRREEQSEVRRAFNIYTTNINFNTSQYTFAGSKEEKRQLIREDKLPTVGAVIRSDLDARDLYRNEVQTALDDAKAEFSYQKRACQGDVTKFDAQDLVSLINTAKKAVDSWFSFVPEKDIMMALEMVKNE
jgi:hypothetical protein